MPVNSVTQKNLVDIIKIGVIRTGINKARHAAANIVKALKADNDSKAVKTGIKYDKKIAKIEAIREKAEVKHGKDRDALNKLIEDFTRDINLKKADLASKYADAAEKAEIETDEVLEEAEKKDRIRRGSGNRSYNHITCRHEEEPDTWVICDNHPSVTKLTKLSTSLQSDLDQMEHEVESVLTQLWLADDRDEVKTEIDRLKKVRTTFDKIISQDPATATL